MVLVDGQSGKKNAIVGSGNWELITMETSLGMSSIVAVVSSTGILSWLGVAILGLVLSERTVYWYEELKTHRNA
jgi:hypothetical protein